MHLQSFIIVFVISFAYGQDRKITSKLNPNCQLCTSEETLVYTRADGSNDTIHQIWDFTRGPPTIIYSIGSLNSSLNIVWDGTIPVRFVMDETPKYSFAASIDKIFEYNDTKNLGHYDPSSPQRAHSLRHMSWNRTDSVLTDKEVKVLLKGRYHNEWSSGMVNIKLDIIPFKDYSADLPHLIHTANSTLVDIDLVNLTTSRGFNSSRFALHFVLVSTDSETETMRYTMRKSLDDEHTPGVFEIIEVKTPESYKNDDGGFIQFRPVAYTEPKRSVSSSTNVHISNLNYTKLPSKSTVGIFYRAFPESDILVQDTFMSFGLSGDGFYTKHNFTAWSFTIGYGSPPLEGFSLLVIVIITIGLAVPVLLALSGVIYVVLRRYKQTNSATRLFNHE